MKVLHAIPSLDPAAGGPINALEGLTTALAKNSVTLEILAPFREGEAPSVANRLKQRGIKITRVGPVRTPIGYHKQLKATAQQAVARNEVVHIHALWEDAQHHTARAAQQFNKPYIIRPCGMLDPWSLSQNKLRKKIYLAMRLKKNLDRASALHFTAEAERDLTDPLNIKATSIIEPNGLNLSEFENLPPAGTFREAYPDLADRPYVLFLSRIHPKKGLDLLIPAFAHAAPLDHVLVIAGPGEPDYIASIKQLAEQHGLANRVLFPGMLEGQLKIAAYAEAKLFALTSYQENFGIVVIESLAIGTPVLISDQINIHTTVSNIQPDAVTKITSIEVIAQQLKQLINTPKNAEQTNRLRLLATEQWDWRPIAKNWQEHYQALIDCPAISRQRTSQ